MQPLAHAVKSLSTLCASQLSFLTFLSSPPPPSPPTDLGLYTKKLPTILEHGFTFHNLEKYILNGICIYNIIFFFRICQTAGMTAETRRSHPLVSGELVNRR